MPSESIPHGQQRPDVATRHASEQDESYDESYERALIRATSAPMIFFPARAHLDHRIKPAAMRVLMSMCWHLNDEFICWPGQNTIAAELGLTQQAVSKSIAQLIALGYVEIARRGFRGTGQTNLYRVNIQRRSQNSGNSPDNSARNSAENNGNSGNSARNSQSNAGPRTLKNSHIQPLVVSIHNATLCHTQPEVVQKNTNEEYQSSPRILGEDVGDGEEETRVNARGALTENIVSAGNLPRQTNRAALAQLVTCHPQISDGAWEFQAAAAAEWFTDHGRRLTLASFASWIMRYEREQQQLTQQAAEQEPTYERPTQHRGSHGRRQTPRKHQHPTGGTVPHTPENDTWEPLDESTWESAEDFAMRLIRENAGRRAAEVPPAPTGRD